MRVLAGIVVFSGACSDRLPVYLEPPDDAVSCLQVMQVGDEILRVQAFELDQGESTPIDVDSATIHALFLDKSLPELRLQPGAVKQDPAGRTLDLLEATIRAQSVEIVGGEAGRWSELQPGIPAGLQGLKIEGTPCEALVYRPAEIPVSQTEALASSVSGPDEVSLVFSNTRVARVPRMGTTEVLGPTSTVAFARAWMDQTENELWALRSDGWIVSGALPGPFEHRARLDLGDIINVRLDGGRNADGVELFFALARSGERGEILRWSAGGGWKSLWHGHSAQWLIPVIAWIGPGQAVAGAFSDLRVIESNGDDIDYFDLPAAAVGRPDLDWIGRVDGLGPVASTDKGQVFARRGASDWEHIYTASTFSAIRTAGVVGRTIVFGGVSGLVFEVVLGYGECKSGGIAFSTDWDGFVGGLIYHRTAQTSFPAFWIDGPSGG